ncbi:hypothetical protein BX666DRAFT_1838720, partial [Dichotomocladium elegans]
VAGAGVAGIWLGWRAWSDWQLANDKRLTPDRYIPLELVEKERLNHNTFRIRLATAAQPSADYPILSCLYIKDDNIQVMRAYTPINDPFHDGFIDLVVKRYEHGSISRMMARTAVGEEVFVRGPMMEYDYSPNSKDEIGMIAGGTGITPMYQLIRRILQNPDDKTKRLWLIYCNKTEEDILLKKELDALQAHHPDRLTIMYVLEETTDTKYARGYVTEDMVRQMEELENRMVFVCGPDGMLSHVSGQRARDFSQGSVTGILGKMGYKSSQVFKLE